MNRLNKVKFVRFDDKCNVPQSSIVFETITKYEKLINLIDNEKQRNNTIVKVLHAIGYDLYVKYVKIGMYCGAVSHSLMSLS